MNKHPVMRYHGGKFRLAPWVMSFFPEHSRYVEAFGGAAGVFIQKKPVKIEIYNDLDGDIVNVFKVLRDNLMSFELLKKIELTPYSRTEFENAYVASDDHVERARRTLVRASMGFGSSGATKGKTGFRSDSRRSGTAAHHWAEYPLTLRRVASRFSGVIIENKDALRVMQDHADQDTLIYADPPYLFTTRKDPDRNDYYRHEMTDADHEELLSGMLNLDAMIVLSSYASELYSDMLSNWTLFTKSSRMSSNRGTECRLEHLWINPMAAERQAQKRMFA